MKNFKYLILLFLLLILTGCVNKKALSGDEFSNIMKKNNYKVNVSLPEESYIDKVLLASRNNINLEFYIMNNSSNANTFYKNNKQMLVQQKKGKYKDNSKTKNNFESYKLEVENTKQFYYIAKIDNTVLFIQESSKNKKQLEDIIEKLNY